MSGFAPANRNQACLLPPDLREGLPADDLTHFVVEEVERDVSELKAGPGLQARRSLRTAAVAAVLAGLALALTTACSPPPAPDTTLQTDNDEGSKNINPPETVLRTHLYKLETETYSLEPFAGSGGAIEVLGGDLLIAMPRGRLALMTPDGALRYLDGQVPMGEAGIEIPSGLARVADILLKEHSPDRFELFVSHHYFTGECFLFRVSSTTLLRDGQDVELSDAWRTVFDARPCFQPGGGGHESGGRLLTDGPDHLLLIVGYHSTRDSVLLEDEDDLGKLLRIEIRTGAAETLTDGHRNPQGLARDAAGDLWAAEHGPSGGDELNLLEPGRHYGYPQVSYGLPYPGAREPLYGREGRHHGFTRPVFAWAPSPGVSALVVNDRRAFPLWDDDLLIASLSGTSYIEGIPGGHSIFRVRRRGRIIQYVERMLVGDGPIRDLTFLPDGRLALLLDRGRVKLLRPINEGHAAKPLCAASRLFAVRCAECHSLNDKTHRAGPHLVGALGRRAGAVEGFAGFSDALRSLDRTWTPRDMERYLVDPQGFAPGTAMHGPAVTAEEARQIVGLIGGGPYAIENLRIDAEERTDGRGDRSLVRRIGGITPGSRYAVQLRTRAANGKVAYSEVVAVVADRYGSFKLRWNASPPEVCATHEYRLRGEEEAKWRPWRRFIPRVEQALLGPRGQARGTSPGRRGGPGNV